MPNLRSYQIESINSLRQGVKTGHNRQILCASTGAGKSICAVELIRLCHEKGSKALFIVDRRVLVSQFSKHLDSYGIKHGTLMAKDENWRPELPIQVASAQTLERMKSFPGFSLVIIDEIHACFRKSIRDLIEANPSAIVIGLTATPMTKGLGKFFTNIVNVITMQELVKQEFLVPFKVFTAHEIDTTGLGINTKGEWKEADLESRAKLIIGDVVSDYLKIADQVWGKTKKTICFSSGVAHGIELAKEFNQRGKNFIAISYLDDDDYKKEVLADFARPDTDIDGLISTDILTRGFDCSDVEHVIVARPLRKSLSMHIQMIGRGARIHPEKQFCVLQCNSGNYLRFQEQFDDIYANGIHDLHDGNSKAPVEPTKKEKKDGACPKCMALWEKGNTSCPVCGFVHERKANIENVHGVIVELGSRVTKEKKEQYSSEYREKFFRQLLGYAQQNRFNLGWAFHKYKEKFGVEPRWKKLPEQPSREVLSWIKSRQIAYAKRKAL